MSQPSQPSQPEALDAIARGLARVVVWKVGHMLADEAGPMLREAAGALCRAVATPERVREAVLS